jgi:heme/copper-type cytochrome/quinol oxidase subunit 3
MSHPSSPADVRKNRAGLAPRPTRRQADLAVWLALLSLAVFFAAAIAAVLLIGPRLGGGLGIPVSLHVATALLIATSFALEGALAAVRREHQSMFRRRMGWALALALGFFAIQGVGLGDLCGRHLAAGGNSTGWILLFVLVALHAAHVLVGLGLLGHVTRQALAGRFDHEYHLGLTLAARYWHFLDAVWLAVLATMWCLA